jgi:hypothetical protein
LISSIRYGTGLDDRRFAPRPSCARATTSWKVEGEAVYEVGWTSVGRGGDLTWRAGFEMVGRGFWTTLGGGVVISELRRKGTLTWSFGFIEGIRTSGMNLWDEL